MALGLEKKKKMLKARKDLSLLLNFGCLLESSESKYQRSLGNEWIEVDGFNISRRKSCPPDLVAKL